MDEELLAILGCPVDKAELVYTGQSLVCTECGKVYEIEDGIPVMLIDRELYKVR